MGWSYLQELLDARDLCALRQAALGVRGVIPGSVAHFNEIDLTHDVTVTVSDPRSASAPGITAAYLRRRDQHPVIVHVERAAGSGPLAISDLVSEAAFQATELYREVYRPLGIVDQLVIRAPHPVATVTLCVGRDAWGFSEVEHATAETILRVLAPVYAALRERESVRRVSRVAGQLVGALGVRVCVVDRYGQLVLGDCAAELDGPVARAIVDLASAAARRGADDVGRDAHRQSETPVVVAESEVADGLIAPVIVQLLESEDGEMWPVLVRPRAQPTRAENLRDLGLSARQADVMARLLRGKSAREAAAELAISPRTVEKHIEASCRILGVRTRTQALLALASRGAAPAVEAAIPPPRPGGLVP